ncbi:hypothetical protein ABT010_34290 [Streptomyces sp. NPDC002668]|uniref:hypothetical protein n=1 Tax=Streptomyces sp. NPDC002668 TaxID=3154422 RepID=UPI003318A4FA
MRVVALCRRGLPIHIGAALLGHLNIQTTNGYVAVFDEDVIQHYQQFLAQRRAERPAEEYREPTTQVRARGPARRACGLRPAVPPRRLMFAQDLAGGGACEVPWFLAASMRRMMSPGRA